jgi:hypothetical protein
VTPRASRLAEEKSLATFRVSGKINHPGLPLQVPQIVYDRLNSLPAKRTEGGHAGCGNPFPDNLQKGLVRQALNFAPTRDVRATLSTSPVEPVASRACARENLFARGVISAA